MECAVRDLLAVEEPRAQLEAHTPVGFIDLLCPASVVEVKHLSKWKQALGQVLAYSTYYPNHSRILHLYSSSIDGHHLDEKEFVCQQLNVNLRHQRIISSAHGPESRVE